MRSIVRRWRRWRRPAIERAALGVAHLLRTLREELELCMAQAGCATLADITPDLIHSSGNGDTPC